MSEPIACSAFPRVGLLGNPSDGFGGKVLSYTFADFRAHVIWKPADFVVLQDGQGRETELANLDAVRNALHQNELKEGAELLGATLLKFGSTEIAFPPGGHYSFRSDIPRQVGMAGSSAIIMAMLRVLEKRSDVELEPIERARLAWTAETEILGIAAGPQDRVIQAYEGCYLMDFSGPWTDSVRTRVPLDRLPPMFVAWQPSVGESSGASHSDIRERFDRGDEDVVRTIQAFPPLAEEGASCLLRGEKARFMELVDRNFDLRSSIWPLKDHDRAMVALGRDHGAAVKLTGSGGAVVGVVRDDKRLGDLERAFSDQGYAFLLPRPVDSTVGDMF